MGLKTTDYRVDALRITLPEAYAYLDGLTSDLAGNTKAIIKVYQNREDATSGIPCFERHEVDFMADKGAPLWEQAYNAAKQEVFNGWENDLPPEPVEDVPEEIPGEPEANIDQEEQ